MLQVLQVHQVPVVQADLIQLLMAQLQFSMLVEEEVLLQVLEEMAAVELLQEIQELLIVVEVVLEQLILDQVAAAVKEL